MGEPVKNTAAQTQPQTEPLMSKQEFLDRIRAKYTEYNGVEDQVVLKEFLTKYPVYYGQVDWGGDSIKKKVQEAYTSPDGYAESTSQSQNGSSDIRKYKNEPDLFPEIYHKVKQLEAIHMDAKNASIPEEGIDLEELLNAGEIKFTNDKGEPCVAEGMRNISFSWGNKWEIIEDLKGLPSHKDGGVDIKITDGGVTFVNNKGKEIKAAHGLMISPKAKPDKPPFDEYYRSVPEGKNDTTHYDLRQAYENLPYDEMIKFAKKNDYHLPDTYKKPTHPTFSNESVFHSDKTPGGIWEYDDADRVWIFEPSLHNIQTMGGEEKYEEWFKANEPDVILRFPRFQQKNDKLKEIEDDK